MRNRLPGTATLHAPPRAGHGDQTLPLPLSDGDEGPRGRHTQDAKAGRGPRSVLHQTLPRSILDLPQQYVKHAMFGLCQSAGTTRNSPPQSSI